MHPEKAEEWKVKGIYSIFHIVAWLAKVYIVMHFVIKFW